MDIAKSLSLSFYFGILTLCVSVSCVGVKSQTSLKGNMVSPTPPSNTSSTNRDFGEDSEIKSVVRQYFELALSGKNEELARLTVVKPIHQPQLSEEKKRKGITAPDLSKMFEELERKHIERDFPELILIGRYRVVDIRTIAKREFEAKTSVSFLSEASPERSRLLIVKLLKVNGNWRIYDITFQEVENMFPNGSGA